ncbi:hypothetical protein HN51_062531 [Arachis hypogaea]|uniref:Uncharacterized protein n=2 Tax=Arachis hypogaea TaxID=3818 RepID=A0A445AT95_ARAHY|nr:protein JINGUBANG-like [Arachis ipaensis]XP_025628933.1 protein JINGUBANG-like [Arachis hypogaea]QHO20019.1 myosin heavy chain kinase B-like [Arachis hypogaea]RYR29642.1 hypothetical protein Ahy_B01g054090 isoform A [Arachis hypogaea]
MNDHHFITSLKTLTPHITCMAVHRNLLYAASLNLINVFDFSHYYSHVDAFNDTNPSSGFVKSITFTATKVFTAHQDRKIRIWFITSSKRHRFLSSLPTVKDCIRRCIVPRNYVSVRRHRRSLWIQHCDTVSGLALNKGLMYSVSWDKSLKVWDLNGYRCLESVKAAHEDAINAVVVATDGTVYTASADGCIKVWERDDKVKRHVLVSTVGKKRSGVNALALSDGGDLFSGGCDGGICRWERKCSVNKGNDVVLVERLRGHGGAILCMISVCGLLVSGSLDRTVRIWQREKENSGFCCRLVLEGHEKPVKSLVAFSKGEEGDDESNGVVTILSGSLDGDIRVWKVFGLA